MQFQRLYMVTNKENVVLEVNEIIGGLLELMHMKAFNTQFTWSYSLEK